MALVLPCTFCNSLQLQRRSFPISRRHSPSFRRGATACEYRIPVEISSPADRGSLAVPSHKVTVHDRQRGVVHEFEVPEDQYILHSAESQNITLPFACRHGCCTSCAVRVKSGELRQPQALGISAELKSQGYALLCVGFPTSDLEVETQDEDEVYWLQFGRYFARGPIVSSHFSEQKYITLVRPVNSLVTSLLYPNQGTTKNTDSQVYLDRSVGCNPLRNLRVLLLLTKHNNIQTKRDEGVCQ